MHTHDRTLISRLGFADPDKRDSMHDLACQYVVQPEVLEKMVLTLRPEDCPRTAKIFGAHTEVVISKGQGQYKQHIGFMDVFFSFESRYIEPHWYLDTRTISENDSRNCPCVAQHRQILRAAGTYGGDVYWSYPPTHGQWDVCRIEQYDGFVSGRVCVEVKVSPTSIADCIRQLKLYAGYTDPEYKFLVTLFDVSPVDAETLRAEGIHHFKLGAAFNAWVEAQKARPAPATIEI